MPIRGMALGRPTLLTTAVQEKICQSIREGNYQDVAARSAGVPVRTYRRWVQLGKKEKSGIYHDLWHAVIEAEADAEITCVRIVMHASKEDAKHAEWWLERKFPARWSSNRKELSQLRRDLNELVLALKAQKNGK